MMKVETEMKMLKRMLSEAKKENRELKKIIKEKEKGISRLVRENALLKDALGDERVQFVLIEFIRFLETYKERTQRVREAILYLPDSAKQHLAARLRGVVADSQDLIDMCCGSICGGKIIDIASSK